MKLYHGYFKNSRDPNMSSFSSFDKERLLKLINDLENGYIVYLEIKT